MSCAWSFVSCGTIIVAIRHSRSNLIENNIQRLFFNRITSSSQFLNIVQLCDVRLQCSRTCGRGSRHRSAICSGQMSDGRWKVLPHADCSDATRHPDGGLLEELCRLPACPSATLGDVEHARWFTSAWKTVALLYIL